MRLWIDDLPALEKELQCRYLGEPMDGVFRNILEGQYARMREDPQNRQFYTFFFLMRNADRSVVGSADFKRAPDANGEVEIGYGLAPAFTGQGYMTMAVSAMCAWALAQQGVLAVTAETECDNTASQNVLRRCGFTQSPQAGNRLLWRLPRGGIPGK